MPKGKKCKNIAKAQNGLIFHMSGMTKVRSEYEPVFGLHIPLHHLKPRSRFKSKKKDHQHSQFNLMPWSEPYHSAWHGLFENLELREVWESIDEIHSTIFFNKNNSRYVSPIWLEKCTWRDFTEEQRYNKINIGILREGLIKNWNTAFGSCTSHCSKWFLKYMMLYVVFGVNMAHMYRLFYHAEMPNFLASCEKDSSRSWALKALFGEGPYDLRVVATKYFEIISKTQGSHK